MQQTTPTNVDTPVTYVLKSVL